MMKLIDLQPGKKAIIRHLDGGHSFIARLASLGFTPGANVVLIGKTEHGPLLVALRGTRIALGQEEAHKIQVSPVEETQIAGKESLTQEKVVIALAGQPNVGKSTVFNSLTGLNQHVGNWAGKTVEQKTGSFSFRGKSYALIDLPGTYSLTASSEEERIARDFIIQEKPTLVIAVVDAATLERNLYLIAELLLLPAPVVLALNMMDVAEQEGIKIEPRVLETALGIPVVPMAASRGQGLVELQETISRMLAPDFKYQPNFPSILPAHLAILEKLKELITPYTPAIYPVDWVALKLLEGDDILVKMVQANMPQEKWSQVSALLYQHEDAILDIAGARYEWIARMVRVAVVEPLVTRVGFTARIDRIFTHRFFGSLALVGVLGLAFWLTYTVGSPIQAWLSGLVGQLAGALRSGLPGLPKALVEFVAGGVLGGVGMVLTFLPILVIFYAILGFMEDTGYLARAAYMTDRWMHLMGLHGKSFIPILLGFGCNVPAVLGTRIIESKRGRLLTILLIPFIPCTARMAVVTILAPFFFGRAAFWVAWGLVGGNLILLAGLGYLLHRFFFEDEHIPFIMELPLYHLPNLKTIGLYVWQNTLGFIQKAGTTILVASLVVWALSYFPTGSVMTSYLGMVGKFLEPIGRLMGLPWPVLVALITSFVAKENTIATLGILYNNINVTLPALISIPAALALLVFQMLFIPCVGTIAAIRHETQSLKWTAVSLGLMLALSLGMGVIIFQVGRLL
jgi:ferrous iron transport protein B